MSTESKTKVIDVVNDQIRTAMEDGCIPWVKTWQAAEPGPHNGATHREYSGINILFALVDAFRNERESSAYFTFKQVKKLGGTIREDERKKSTIRVFYTTIVTNQEDVDEHGADPETRRFMRYYRVWNWEQVDWAEGKEPKRFTLELLNPDATPLDNGEALIKQLKADGLKLRHTKGARAAFNPDTKVVTMPRIEQFESEEEYYSTLWHEVGHWFLDKEGTNENGYHSDVKARAREELTVEMFAAYVQHAVGMTVNIPNATAYLQHWLGNLQEDAYLFTTAAAKASKYFGKVTAMLSPATTTS